MGALIMKTMKSLHGLLLLLAALLSIPSIAQNKYYIATTTQGGNDANSGTSINAPYATVSVALAKALPGDTIFVRSGTYTSSATIRINRPGTAANHIVLTIYKPDLIDANSRPVFDFSGMQYSSSNRGFLLSGANYWDIFGIVIKGAGDNGMNVGGTSFTTITFCSFTRNRDTGLQLGGASHHITITNCDSYENADLGPGSTSAGGNADGFAPKLDVGDSIWFRGCRAWLNSDDGWDGYLRPSNNVNAFLEDCWTFRNGYYWLDGSTTSSQNGNGFKLGGSDTKDLGYNFTLVRCLSFYNKANGFDQNSNAGQIALYNCSAYQNLGRDYFMTSGSVIYQPGAKLTIRNCLSLGARGVSLPAASTAARPYEASNNSFLTATSSSQILSFDTAGVTARRNVDGSLPAIDFMRLNPAAPKPYTYIDAGVALPDVIYHGVKGVSFNGAAPDLGLFESSLSVLPVGLLSFSAIVKNADVRVTWQTASELNNKGWFVERSKSGDNLSWSSLGFVQGAGNSSDIKNYNFNDKSVSAGIYQYRLKQIDLDGHKELSKIIAVTVGNRPLTTALSMYPNPSKSAITIQYVVPVKSRVNIGVYSTDGQLLSRVFNEEQQAGSYQRTIDTHLRNGKYLLKVAAGTEVSSSILFIQ